MANVAIITARGGSKRIPRKNIKEFIFRDKKFGWSSNIETIIFEDGMTARELYEEHQVATEYELQKGILKCTNEREIQRAIDNREYYW